MKSTPDNTSEYIPSGSDVYRTLVKNIQTELFDQFEDGNSIFRAHLKKPFANYTEIRLAIGQGFRALWESASESAIRLGLAGDLSAITRENVKVQKELEILGDQVFKLIEPAIVKNQSQTTTVDGVTTITMSDTPLIIDFSPKNLRSILQIINREAKSLDDAKHLKVGEQAQTPNIAMDRMTDFLEHAPSRMRATLRKNKYPANVPNKLFQDDAISRGISTIIQTATFGFMTYGWHGLAYNAIDSAARSERMASHAGGWAEAILSHPILEKCVTGGVGLTAATLLGYGLVAGTRRRREFLIKDAEATAKAGKPVKVGSFIDRNGLFGVSLAVAVVGAGVEGAGILSHEVKGYYTAQKAAETAKMVDEVLNTSDPESIVGKAYQARTVAANIIRAKSKEFYESELTRPGASGAGPAAVAKKYLQDGPAVLQNPILAKDPTLHTIVQGTETELSKYKSHVVYPSFAAKAELISGVFKSDADALREMGSGQVVRDAAGNVISGFMTNVANMRGSAQSTDLFAAQDMYKRKVAEFIDGQKSLNTKWTDITHIYQNFINSVAAGADAKYRSKTTFDANFNFTPPDLVALVDKLNEKPPELEGRNPVQYFHELGDLVGKVGGLTETEKWAILLFVFARSGLLELVSGGKLIGSLRRIRKYYARPNNLPSINKVELMGLYDDIVTSVHETFSGKNWNAIFPDHSGISHDDAEYLVRHMFVEHNPLLDEFLPIKHNSGKKQGVFQLRKITKQIGGLYGKILTGDSRTDNERFLLALNNVLTSLSLDAKKEHSSVGISMKSMRDLIASVLPKELHADKKLPNEERFNKICAQISHKLEELRSISSQTIEHDAEIRVIELQDRMNTLRNWVIADGQHHKGQIESSMLATSDKKRRIQYTAVYDMINNLKDSIDQYPTPTVREVEKLEAKQAQIILELAKLSVVVSEGGVEDLAPSPYGESDIIIDMEPPYMTMESLAHTMKASSEIQESDLVNKIQDLLEKTGWTEAAYDLIKQGTLDLDSETDVVMNKYIDSIFTYLKGFGYTGDKTVKDMEFFTFRLIANREDMDPALVALRDIGAMQRIIKMDREQFTPAFLGSLEAYVAGGYAYSREQGMPNTIYALIVKKLERISSITNSFEQFRSYVELNSDDTTPTIPDIPVMETTSVETPLTEAEELSNDVFTKEVIDFLDTQDLISRTKLMKQFTLSQENAEKLLQSMRAADLIGSRKGNGQYEVLKK